MAHYVHTVRLTLIQAIGLFLFVLGLTADAVLILIGLPRSFKCSVSCHWYYTMY